MQEHGRILDFRHKMGFFLCHHAQIDYGAS